MAERNYNHIHIFDQAERFFSLYYEIMKENKQNNDYANYVVEFTNGTFACELFLKAMLMKLDIEVLRTHKLLDLFNLLPQILKDDIGTKMHREGYAYPEYPEKGCALDQFMHVFSNGFEKFRYEHESLGPLTRGITYPGLLEDYTLIIRAVASEIIC